MDNQLKPCPFCDGEARVVESKTFLWIKCTNLPCLSESGGHKTRDEAVAAWNRRAANDK